jgi:hypothetical protein
MKHIKHPVSKSILFDTMVLLGTITLCPMLSVNGVNPVQCLSGELLQGCIDLLPMMCDEGFVEHKIKIDEEDLEEIIED